MNESRTSQSSGVVKPPVGLFYPLGLSVVLGVAAIPISARPAHIVGWALGAVIVPAIAIGFRAIDRKRRTSALYVGQSGVGIVPTVALLVGMITAVANAYRYFEQVVIV